VGDDRRAAMLYVVLFIAMGLAAAAAVTLTPMVGDPLRFANLRVGMVTASLALLVGWAVAMLA
jgi:hypothetical protein